MSKKIEMVGRKFGRLTVIEEDLERYAAMQGRKRVVWKCICDCGKEVSVRGEDLRSGNTTSCGCYIKEFIGSLNKKYNNYDLSGEYGIGYDSNGRSFTFDLEDYDLIKDYCWLVHNSTPDCYNPKYYAVTNVWNDPKRNGIRMHRLIMGVLDDPKAIIDHIDGDGCNNRKSNLRICTTMENSWNTKPQTDTASKYKGVARHREKWCAKITKNKQVYRLGVFETEIEAAIAYNNAAKELFGEYACLNEIHYNNEIKEITN